MSLFEYTHLQYRGTDEILCGQQARYRFSVDRGKWDKEYLKVPSLCPTCVQVLRLPPDTKETP